MNLIIVALLLLLSLAQPSFHKKIAAFTYVIPAIYINYFAYFPSDSLFLWSALSEGVVICIILNVVKCYAVNLVQKLQLMCLALVALQFSFYCLWNAHVKIIGIFTIQDVYTYVWTAYYLLILKMLIEEAGSHGIFAELFEFFGADSNLYKRNIS
tara:strand:- start:1 stop:465 length:465 start_codon:yes stop_codon:yes gene_type:complete